MCRRSNAIWIAACVGVLAWHVGLGHAQPAPETSESSADTALERYLSERGLDDLLGAHWRRRLREAPPTERTQIAERLAKLYVRQLASAATREARQRVEDDARTLLLSVPDAESFALRVDLAKATYLKAEEICERSRLQLSTPEELQDAERIFRTVGPIFKEIGGRVHERVESMENKEASGRQADTDSFRESLAEARRLRSLSRYYSGWCSYYLALRTGQPQHANDAILDFGWLLNAEPGRAPTLEKVPAGLLKYDHIAWSAIGVGMSLALRGKEGDAIRWLEAVEAGEGISAQVRDKLFLRKLVVLAGAGRWADVELIVRRKRQPDRTKPAAPLSTAEARLLAILALEGSSASAADRVRGRELLEPLAQLALGDLVARGDAGHVLDIVNRYGTAPIGQEGFIVQYVRGLQAYESAHAQHEKEAAGDPKLIDSPPKDVAIRGRYREAAELLELCVKAADAERFAAQRVKAELRAGLSRYYAADFEAASALFRSVFERAPAGSEGREALWYAIVSLDRAVEAGRPSLEPKRDALATLYIERFPGTENAAKLLLRRAGALLTPDQAAAVLLAIPKESPLYLTCRREACRLLYQVYRSTPAAGRDLAAARFAQISEEVIELDRAKLNQNTQTPDTEAGKSAILRGRQLAEVALALANPDLPRAENALAIVEEAASLANLSLSDVEAELAYRRVHIAMIRADFAAAEKELDLLRRRGGPFSDAADRIAYREAARQWSNSPGNVVAAKRVLQHGLRVLDQFPDPAVALKDASIAAVYNTVAAAAKDLWDGEHDPEMRDIALRLDDALIGSGKLTGAALKRRATLAESAGDNARALDDWRTLLAAQELATEPWYEARANSLRLLAITDPDAAREVLRQHVLLYPQYGPEPWGPIIKEIDFRLNPEKAKAGEGGGS